MPSKDKDVRILTIPKEITRMIQILYIYGFRIWKNFVRTFNDRILLLNYDINLHLRNNIIKLQSLTHTIICNCNLSFSNMPGLKVARRTASTV